MIVLQGVAVKGARFSLLPEADKWQAMLFRRPERCPVWLRFHLAVSDRIGSESPRTSNRNR